jgi:hypothetical protein
MREAAAAATTAAARRCRRHSRHRCSRRCHSQLTREWEKRVDFLFFLSDQGDPNPSSNKKGWRAKNSFKLLRFSVAMPRPKLT